MSDYPMADIGSMWGATDITATHSTSRKNNTDLDMTDFLQLMVVQLQNQTMDNAMDTSEMMNQMVQMQMVTAITNMTETNIMTYASSLVGKVVTVGILNGDDLEERAITVMGTGTYDGQQVIFGSDGEMYSLKQIMAVGILPDENGSYDTWKPGGGTDGGDTTPPDNNGGNVNNPGTGSGDADNSGDSSAGGIVTPPDSSEPVG